MLNCRKVSQASGFCCIVFLSAFFFFVLVVVFCVQGEYDFADTSRGSSKEKEEEMRLGEDFVVLSDPEVEKQPMQLMGGELQADEVEDAREGSCLRQTKVPY